MLRELKIRNFAIVDTLSVEFQPGLNVLTGETGAGKSLVVGALELLLGARAQSDQIKADSDSAEAQAFFDIGTSPVLERLGIDTEEGVNVRRVISRDGKGRVYINDTLANVRTLDEFGRDLVDIHGQHDHQGLLSQERQLDFIDSFARLGERLAQYRAVFDEAAAVRAEIEDLRERAKDRAHRTDLLSFQVDEIRSACVTPGEMAELDEERKILFNATKLRELCEEIYSLLYEGDHAAADAISAAADRLRTIAGYDASAEESLELITSALPLVEDAVVSGDRAAAAALADLEA